MHSKFQSVRELEKLAQQIRDAGGIPNARFARALRAARALEAMLDKPAVAPEGAHYCVTCANGRTVTVFVPKGSDVFKEAKAQHLEMVSFVKQ